MSPLSLIQHAMLIPSPSNTLIAPEDGLEVFNPATNERICVVRCHSSAEIEASILSQEQKRQEFQRTTATQRAARLKAWFELIMSHQHQLAHLITLESGKPMAESLAEVAYGASFVEWFAEEAKRVYGDVIPSHAEGRQILTLKQPIGVCAAITPWNFPIAMVTRKVAPALAAGCPIVVKPAESTPLTALAIEALARKVGIDDSLFKVVVNTKPEDVGRLFCQHAAIRKISFTGSTQVGRTLMAQAASTIKKVSLELGGNAPFIVFDDADISAAVTGAMVAKFRNAGQTCICVNRFLVQDRVYDEFVEQLLTQVSSLRVGNGLESSTQIGPLISHQACNKVSHLVADARAKGARVLMGGNAISGTGSYFEPTIITEVTADMEIYQQEIFGPVISILRFNSEHQAVNLANDTIYGLAAYCYTRDLGRSWRMLNQLEYGMVAINEGLISTEVAPFGGIKQSGLGREGSKYGIDEYLEMKYCLIGGIENGS